MRKFPKAFTRRKSTANAFEDMADSSPAEPSFKVFERGDLASKSFDGGLKLARPPASGPGRPKYSQSADDNMFENLGNNRGSGTSNSNTASTTDNSSRLSAASTAASSTDLPGREERRSPHDKPYGDIPLPTVPKSVSAFSLKTAGRSLSWGRNKPSTPPTPKDTSKDSLKDGFKDLPSLPMEHDNQSGRSRAVTASSYASTATPPKLDERDLGLSLGGDFSDMFSGFGKRKSALLEEQQSNRAMSHSPDQLLGGPAIRPTRLNPPAPLYLDKTKQIEGSPYSWNSQTSHDELMSSTSPPPLAPRHDSPPPVPQHNSSRTDGVLTRGQRPGAPAEIGLRRSSAVTAKRQSTLEYGDAVDEDAKLLRESMNAGRRLNDPGYTSTRVRDSWTLPSNSSYKVDDASVASWRADSVETTPKPKKLDRNPISSEENMFDSQIAASAGLAERFQQRSDSPPKAPRSSHKVMTPAQFEKYKQDQERLRSYGGKSREDEDMEEENYEDEEDEADKARAVAKLRRKQEAHMAVYRQQMMKVTGETPAIGRPGMYASSSSPNLVEQGRGEEGEEEDEEIPLAILQAHGFPNKNRPPIRTMGSNPNLRASTMSVAGGGGDGRLPVFARNLPQDPYIGAGLHNPMHRESLAFGAGSVSGAPPRGLPPGGLVGVIATEERSRAMRRGSPNAQGEYGPQAPNGYGPVMPPMARASTTGSMFNGMPPGGMGPMGPMGMNPTMMTPGDQAQLQMSQQMQQFMQMQMQFMQMMTSGQGPPQTPQQGEMPRPNSSHHLRNGSGTQTHQRAMTMMDPNAAPWMQQGGMAPSIHIQGGYASSIAPSERSNVGMPGRYRPVSQMPVPDNKNRPSTMSGALPNWDTRTTTTTVKPVPKSANASDEDDEEGWEEMAKKREKKRSLWKTKRDTNGFKDMLHLTQ